MRTLGRTVALALIVMVALVTRAGPASACSCAQLDPVVAVPHADAAFVGTYTGRQLGGVNPDTGEVFYVFEVEEWVKGDLGNPVAIRSSASGASCGFEVPAGQRVGVVISMDNGTPTGGLCSTSSAADMLTALPDVSGPTVGPATAAAPESSWVSDRAPAIGLVAVLGALGVVGAWLRRRSAGLP